MNTIFGSQNLEIFSQLILAVILGVLIGVERELTGRLAGVKTHALVCLGACLFTILSVVGFRTLASLPAYNPLLIASNIVVGIGFIGAGLIVFQQSKVHGLTTAAGIWVTAGIGMAVGVKMYSVAVFAALLVLLVFIFLYFFENYLHRIWGRKDENEES